MNYIVSVLEKITGLLSGQAGLMSIVGLFGFGTLSGLYANYLRGTDMKTGYLDLKRPGFAPPGWLFGVVWTILYILMGVGLGSIINSETRGLLRFATIDMRSFLIVWFILQYALNFAWSLVYFGCDKIAKTKYLTLGLSVFVILMTVASFLSDYRIAGWCFLPYSLWTSFATLLHWEISKLNPDR